MLPADRDPNDTIRSKNPIISVGVQRRNGGYGYVFQISRLNACCWSLRFCGCDTALVFALLEPFAESMWRHSIADFASVAKEFTWRKEIYFGGPFQKVVVERPASDGVIRKRKEMYDE